MGVRVTTAATLAALAAAGPLSGCGSEAASKSGAARSSERPVRLSAPPPVRRGVDGDFTPIFHGESDFVPGDSFIKWSRLEGGGFLVEHCVIAQQRTRRFRCSRTFVVRAGQLVAVGESGVPDGRPVGLPVVGGTGAYEGAHGTVTSSEGRRGGLFIVRLP